MNISNEIYAKIIIESTFLIGWNLFEQMHSGYVHTNTHDVGFRHLGNLGLGELVVGLWKRVGNDSVLSTKIRKYEVLCNRVTSLISHYLWEISPNPVIFPPF